MKILISILPNAYDKMQHSLVIGEIILSVATEKVMFNVLTPQISGIKTQFSVQTPLRSVREKGQENLQDFSSIHPLLFPADLVSLAMRGGIVDCIC